MYRFRVKLNNGNFFKVLFSRHTNECPELRNRSERTLKFTCATCLWFICQAVHKFCFIALMKIVVAFDFKPINIKEGKILVFCF